MGRIAEVDAIRGVAILLMVIYHIFFDLDYLSIMDINLHDIGWLLFQRTVGTLFLLVAGISMVLSESRNREGYLRHAKRALKLGAVAALITVVTWLYPHDGFIMFGVIHMIAVSTLIAPLFFRLGWLNVLLGLAIIIAGLPLHHTDVDYLFWLGWVYPGYAPLDHYPLIPWFGVILLGISIGQRMRWIEKTANKYANGLAFLGRHSLTIYLLHQPILFGIMLLL